VGLKRGCAIRTYDPQIVDPVVVVHAVDVVENEGHPATVPELALTAQFAPAVL
jgi:hypothetical protein